MKRSFVVASLCFVLISQSAQARKEKLEYIEVPILYATSRAAEMDGDRIVRFGGARNFEHVDQGVSYGTVKVVIPTSHVLDEPLKELGCKPSSKESSKVPRFERLTHETDFIDYLNGKQKNKSSELCVFVHGYNNSFQSAAATAARLQVGLERPVLMFSWPSQAKTKDYVVDECNAEWSVRAFQIFMQHVEKSIGPQLLMTVSHSMGNRLVNWYLQSRSDRADQKPTHFKEVVLTSPDIDRATFKNYFYKITNNADRVRVYVSAKDLPLRLSKAVHGAERAGSGKVAKDLEWQIPSNLPHTQVVDFSAVDSGWLGHSIQYEIISSMHTTNSPGTGLKAMEDSTYKGNFVRILRNKN